MSIFQPWMNSEQKERVRIDLYSYVARILPSKPCGIPYEFLILPGRSPQHEVSCIRERVCARITAIDKDELAASVARRVADISIHGNLLRTDLGRFDFVNLDLCGNISQKAISLIKRTIEVTDLFSIFVIIGREHDTSFASMPLPKSIRGFFNPTYMRIAERIGYLCYLMRFNGFHAQRIWHYRGNSHTMGGILFGRYSTGQIAIFNGDSK